MGASWEIFCYIQLQKWFIHSTKKTDVVLLILRRCKCKLNKIISVRVTDILVNSDNNYDCKSAEVEYLHKITACEYFFGFSSDDELSSLVFIQSDSIDWLNDVYVMSIFFYWKFFHDELENWVLHELEHEDGQINLICLVVLPTRCVLSLIFFKLDVGIKMKNCKKCYFVRVLNG